MYRVTNSMKTNDLLLNLNNSMKRMNTYEEQLATGRKINKPSDDPSGLVVSMHLQTSINEGQQYISNIGEANDYMNTTDGALNNINQILQRIRELTVKAANGTNTASDTETIAAEVGQLEDQIKDLANTTYGNKYVFAGTNVTQAPAGGEQWTGNTNDFNIEIGPGVTVAVNQNMTSFFGNPSGKDASGNADGGIFDVLSQLQTDMEEGNTSAISSALGKLDDKINDLSYNRATLGAKINRMQLQQSRLESEQTSLTGLLSQNEDVDVAQAITQFKMEENVYKSALSVGAAIIQPSLADFLK